MPPSMRVFMLRHAESRSNAATGVVSLPEEEGDRLSERGLAQAEAAAELISSFGPARIVSSPMRRARETAAPIAARCGLEVEIWDWTHELVEPADYPRLSGEEQQRRRWSNRMREHANDPTHAPPGGESFAGLVGRVERTLERLADDDVDGTLLVGHGIFLRFTFVHTLLGTGFTPYLIDRLWRIGSLNCGLSIFQHNRGGGDSINPADIDGWRCVSWMAPTVPPEQVTGTGGGGPGN
jgi:broad specificity phosphatase PhoE